MFMLLQNVQCQKFALKFIIIIKGSLYIVLLFVAALTSNHKFFLLFLVSCAPPFPPANGSIEAYNSTQVGIKVQFHCDEGYIPTEWKTAQCQRNGTWTQKPSVLNCTVGKYGL